MQSAGLVDVQDCRLASPQNPVQQGTSVEHGCDMGAHDTTSQKQAVTACCEPHATFPSTASRARHDSPVQHSLPPAVQAWSGSLHWTGAVQTPFVHVSAALQQPTIGATVLHACPVLPQTGPASPLQVPLVEPGGTTQVRPEQQSAVTVHASFSGWHGGRQIPLASQIDEQQSASDVQVAPFGLHDSHVPPRQKPTQHCVVCVQASPGMAVQLPPSFAQTHPISPT